MKRIFSILMFAFIGVVAHAQVDAIDRFFSSYEDDPNFTVVYVSPKMFQMVTKVAGEETDDEIMDVIQDLKGLKILKTDVDPLNVYKDAKAKINTDDYEVLLTARDKGQNVRFLTKTAGEDVIEELLLLVGGEKEFVLLSFVGTLDLNKIAKLASKLDLDGAEHLEKLKNE